MQHSQHYLLEYAKDLLQWAASTRLWGETVQVKTAFKALMLKNKKPGAGAMAQRSGAQTGFNFHHEMVAHNCVTLGLGYPMPSSVSPPTLYTRGAQTYMRANNSYTFKQLRPVRWLQVNVLVSSTEPGDLSLILEPGGEGEN